MQKILVLLMMSLFVVACGHRKDAKSFEKALEAATGQKHSVAKLNTEKGKFVVFKNDVTGEYAAYDMDKWNHKSDKTLNDFMNKAVAGKDYITNLYKDKEWHDSGYYEPIYVYNTYSDEYYDNGCDCYRTETWTEKVYVGERYVDTSHWYTYYTGGGFRFDNTSAQSKDLETFAALQEEAAEKFMSFKLASEFSLSSNRADELAKLANRYQKLENSRELTDSEKDKFAMDALGVSMAQVEVAMKKKAEGSESAYQAMLQSAAKVNNTTPEQIGKFFNEMVDM
jgi:uncharacterized lipoprotein YehR (DUF1307 family)